MAQRRLLPPPEWDTSIDDDEVDGDLTETPGQRLDQAIDKLLAARQTPSQRVERSSRPQGRPSTYDPAVDEVVEALHMLGSTVAVICSILGICSQTYYDWCAKYTSFAAAVIKGRELADARVARSLYHRAVGYSHPEEKVYCQEGRVTRVHTTKHYPPDTAAAQYWMNNRGRGQWRHAVDVTQRLADGQNVDPSTPPVITINATPSPRKD